MIGCKNIKLLITFLLKPLSFDNNLRCSFDKFVKLKMKSGINHGCDILNCKIHNNLKQISLQIHSSRIFEIRCVPFYVS